MTPPPVGVEAVLTLGAEVAVETGLTVFYFTLWKTQERSEDRAESIQPSFQQQHYQLLLLLL